MKKNPGRKQRRAFARQMKHEANQTKTYPEKEVKVDPHPNAIVANKKRKQIEGIINDKMDLLKLACKKESALGKQMLQEQKERLVRKEIWLRKVIK